MFSSTSRIAHRQIPSSLSRIEFSLKSQTHFIFGANTDVGKSVITAGLIRASGETAHYIKPLQCGGSDQRFVTKHAPNVASATTLFEWESYSSPHVASRNEGLPVSDEQVLSALENCLADLPSPSRNWIETAGGVLSPSSASPDNCSAYHALDDRLSWGWLPQADLYQPLLAIGSVVLVGDGRLGGISATLSSLESLLVRGYYVSGIVLLETGFSNHEAIQEYASRRFKLRSEDGLALFKNPQDSIISLPALPPEPEPLIDWYESDAVKDALGSFVQNHLNQTWQDRADGANGFPRKKPSNEVKPSI